MKLLKYFIAALSIALLLTNCKQGDDKNVYTLVEASALEAEVFLVFQNSEGVKISFLQNYDNPVIAKYNFISADDGHSANTEYINKKFKIEFAEEIGDVLDESTGEYKEGKVNKLKSIELLKE